MANSGARGAPNGRTHSPTPRSSEHRQWTREIEAASRRAGGCECQRPRYAAHGRRPVDFGRLSIYEVSRLLGHSSVIVTEAGLRRNREFAARRSDGSRYAVASVPRLGKTVTKIVTCTPKTKKPEGRNPRELWSQRSDLNRRPADYESAALPAELRWRPRRSIGTRPRCASLKSVGTTRRSNPRGTQTPRPFRRRPSSAFCFSSL